MHPTMHRHYHRGYRRQRPFWPGLLFFLLLFMILKGWFFVLLLPFIVFGIFCALASVFRGMAFAGWCESGKRKNDDFVLEKRKNDVDRRYVQTEDGDWVEIV